MKRIPAVMAAVAASAALATATIGAGAAPPAVAAPSPHTSQAKTVQYQVASVQANHTGKRVKSAKAAKPAKPAKAAKTGKAAKAADPAKLADPRIVSQYNSGQYVTVVTCHGVDIPGPVRLNLPHIPLQLNGDIPTPAIVRALAQPRAYKKVYTCTVTVEQKVPAPVRHVPHHVTVNTGFGGRANSVARHHPAH